MPLALQEQSYVGFRVQDSTRAVGDFWLNRTFGYAGSCILNYFGRLLTLALINLRWYGDHNIGDVRRDSLSWTRSLQAYAT